MIQNNVSFDILSINRGHLSVTYRGVPALKCPFDYVLYQMLFMQLKPDLVIEIGTFKGGGALYYADLLELIGKGEVHTIDLETQCNELTKRHPRIKVFSGGWQAYPLENAKGYETVLVIEDSSHTYQNTLDAMNRFADVVTPGSYMIVEDGILDCLVSQGVYSPETYNGGPVRAIEEFLQSHSDRFQIDRGLCDFFGINATWNPNGYLRKL
ncbi:CmcI family methyltransferase [Rhizomicrobium electricum]|uniref:CmcI family methyltransferase n=1 Tax=Rhizomicrobium electricum TaxID=480070 RepID=A0ABP3Q388_9PROT|nr:CmcI family methyltransferase [Rhizomicrobium electricum]NIJ49382.1 cephalosporin hydroxylase [Rhizomicrobium electricum]